MINCHWACQMAAGFPSEGRRGGGGGGDFVPDPIQGFFFPTGKNPSLSDRRQQSLGTAKLAER